jgi:hypothetical protein
MGGVGRRVDAQLSVHLVGSGEGEGNREEKNRDTVEFKKISLIGGVLRNSTVVQII